MFYTLGDVYRWTLEVQRSSRCRMEVDADGADCF